MSEPTIDALTGDVLEDIRKANARAAKVFSPDARFEWADHPISDEADKAIARADLVVVHEPARPAPQVFADCSSCGSEHMAPVPCGMTFLERMRSVQVSEQGFDTAEKANYYDRAALDEAFGPDRREQMLHETRGLGPVQTAEDGSTWVYDDPDTREMRPLEQSDIIGGYLRGTPEGELPEDA